MGTLEDGRKIFVWGGLPGEEVEVRVTKKKSKYLEGVVEKVLTSSKDRVEPTDPESYLSTSPWQIINFAAEQKFKSQLIHEAFELHKVPIPNKVEIYTNNQEFHYRNKVEFSWYGDTDETSGLEKLDLAFFKRASRGKIVVNGTSLATDEINNLARAIRDLLRQKNVSARQLKTLLIRSNKQGKCTWQLYTKDKLRDIISQQEANMLPTNGGGGEVIFSNPKSPASVVTERLNAFNSTVLEDNILDTPFSYATEGFFQVNLPVYEQAVRDIKNQLAGLPSDLPIVDMYSGVGTIGLTVSDNPTTLVEVNEFAVAEMRRNIQKLNKNATAVLSTSENSLDHITNDRIIIVDPPRAGLHADVTHRILDQLPPYVVYLSCNPVTQARDVSLLLEKYQIKHIQGYNFFPRTPHIENLVVLKLA